MEATPTKSQKPASGKFFYFLWRAGEGEVQCQRVPTEERDDHVTKRRLGIEPSLSPGKTTYTD